MKLYYWLNDWQLPGQQHKGAGRVEIPTDAAGLCAWLNARKVPICLPLNPPPAPAEPAAPEPIQLRPPVAAAAPCRTASDIVEFILDGATVAEIENIFAALGTRFAEQRKAA